MTPELATAAAAVAVYAAVVLVLGAVATRRAARSPEEYFLAGRGLGTLVLFMALFGTNATSFVLVGIPGRAYHDGIGVFGLNAPIVALGIPLSFWAIGSPARRMAQRLGALTPAELYTRRFGAPAVGGLLFLAFTAYTLPYMVQALKGAAGMLASAGDGAVPEWLGALVVIGIALAYTSLGGMRATAWTNVFQGALFLVFSLCAFVFVSRSLGGLDAATARVEQARPDLLVRGTTGLFAPGAFASWGLVISLTVIAFPHMLARLMAARDQRALRHVCRSYPLALALLWLPVVWIGVWGAVEFPGLEGPESDAILSLMTARHMPAALGGLAFLAVLAAVMSTLDAQLLTLSSMLVRDLLDPLRRRARGPRAPHRPVEAADVRAGRLFALAVSALVYVLALSWGESVFEISRFAFEGYVTLVVTLFLGVRWRRFTAAGAVASIVVGNAVLLALRAGGQEPLGFLPVFWAFVASALAAVVGSLAGGPPDPVATERAFGPARSGASP